VDPGYIAVLACRNEEQLIGGSIEGVLGQSLTPLFFVVVDDGSQDGTPLIVQSYMGKVKLLRLSIERIPVRGINQSLALMRGAKLASKMVPDWKYLLKLDADSYLSPDYVELLLAEFERDPLLGVASGIPIGEKMWKRRASDGAKVYRRECWNDIDGLKAISGFDLYAILNARMNGWRVKSFPDICYEQKRNWEKRTMKRWMLAGQVRYKFGYSIYHTALASAMSLKKKPRVMGSLIFFLTHLTYKLSGSNKPLDEEVNRFMEEFCKNDIVERISDFRNKLSSQ